MLTDCPIMVGLCNTAKEELEETTFLLTLGKCKIIKVSTGMLCGLLLVAVVVVVVVVVLVVGIVVVVVEGVVVVVVIVVSGFKINIQKKHRNRCLFAFSQPLKTQMGHFPGQFWGVLE